MCSGYISELLNRSNQVHNQISSRQTDSARCKQICNEKMKQCVLKWKLYTYIREFLLTIITIVIFY
jgi:hypothetical protein